MKKLAINELAVFALAVQFLTRIPVPVGQAYSAARLAAAPRYYPLVGSLVGVICALVYAASVAYFTPALGVLLAVATGALVTGAFHEDGLADTFDGLGGLDRDRTLSIMRDSRIGTYGAIALALALAIKAAALLALPAEVVVAGFVVAHGLSRLSAVLVIATSRYARDHGTGKPTADGIEPGGLAVALATGAALLAGLSAVYGVGAALAAVSGCLIGHLAMRALFERRLGGYTGDTLGAVQQTSELGIYLGLVLCLSS